MEVSIVIPVFNESENFGELLARVTGTLAKENAEFEILFVDDASTDGSAEMIVNAAKNDPRVRGIFLSENIGQQLALLRGIAESTGIFCITLDADLQNPPEEIPKVLALLRGGHDVVGSVRRERMDSLLRRACSRIANFWARKMAPKNFEMHDYGCMLRGYAHSVVEPLSKRFSGSRNSLFYLSAVAMAFAKNPAETIVEHASRSRGKSKYSPLRLLQALFSLLMSCRLATKIMNKVA